MLCNFQMNRVFLLFHNICRWGVNKLRYGGRYQASPLQKISLLATIGVHCRGRVKLGRKVELSAGTDIQVYGDGQLEIGDRVYMNRYCMVSCLGRIRIGAGTLIGPGVRIFDNNHRFGKEGVRIEVKAGEIEIGENCWIASNAVLLKGARIGSNSVIGAGCVIDYEVPPATLVRTTQPHSHTPIE